MRDRARDHLRRRALAASWLIVVAIASSDLP
jgi:hypothetical protein